MLLGRCRRAAVSFLTLALARLYTRALSREQSYTEHNRAGRTKGEWACAWVRRRVDDRFQIGNQTTYSRLRKESSDGQAKQDYGGRRGQRGRDRRALAGEQGIGGRGARGHRRGRAAGQGPGPR